MVNTKPQQHLDTKTEAKRLQEEYNATLRALEKEVRTMKAEKADRAAKDRASQLQRLSELVIRKSEIEAGILQHTSELNDAYQQTKAEFQAVLSGQLADCDEAINDLDASRKENPDEAKNWEHTKKTHHAGGDQPTDAGGIILDVPDKDQIERAEKMAREGKRS